MFLYLIFESILYLYLYLGLNSNVYSTYTYTRAKLIFYTNTNTWSIWYNTKIAIPIPAKSETSIPILYQMHNVLFQNPRVARPQNRNCNSFCWHLVLNIASENSLFAQMSDASSQRNTARHCRISARSAAVKSKFQLFLWKCSTKIASENTRLLQCAMQLPKTLYVLFQNPRVARPQNQNCNHFVEI